MLSFYRGLLLPYLWAHAKHIGAEMLHSNILLRLELRTFWYESDLSSGCSFIAGTKSFRTAWAIQFIPCVFLLAGLPFLPRSPRWLAKVGRVDEAVEILARIQAGGDVNDPLVVAEWEEITTILAAERGKALSSVLSTPISHLQIPIVNPFENFHAWS